MKDKKRLAWCICLLAAVLAMTAYYYVDSRRSLGFRVVCLNSDKKIYTDEESYFYADPDSGEIYRYDLNTQETELVYPGIDTSDEKILRPYLEDFAVYQDWIYFVWGKALCKYNYRTGEEIFLKRSDGTFSIDISGQYLFYYDTVLNNMTDDPNLISIYMCPIDGDIEKDSVNINAVFAREAEKDSGDQTITYEGFDIIGQTSSYENSDYVFIYGIREHDSGKRILSEIRDRSFMLDDGAFIWFSLYRKPCYEYETVQDAEEQEITCLQDAADWQEYKDTRFYEKYMIQEGNEIICLLQVTDSSTGEAIWQKYSKKDILFKLNPEMGESSIIYETENNETRIIGYQDGKVYLLRNFKVYAQSIDDGEEEKLFSLPTTREIYYFDWYQDYLIVTDLYRKNEVVEVYKIE